MPQLIGYILQFFLGIHNCLFCHSWCQQNIILCIVWVILVVISACMQGNLVKPDNPMYLRIISYCVIFIPTVLAFASFPLNIHPMVNNIYTVFMGHDTSKSPRNIRYRLLLLMLRFLAAIIPVLLACGVSNLFTVRRYSGPLVFAITVFFPTALQLQSIRVCKKKFQGVHVRLHMVRNAVHDSGGRYDKDKGTASSTVLHSLQFMQTQNKSFLYMTPYSSRVFSHPIAVIVIGAIGLLLFLLSIANLFVSKYDCASPWWCILLVKWRVAVGTLKFCKFFISKYEMHSLLVILL